MTIDLIKLKALATAAAANQYDAVALHDSGTAVPPTTVLGLIAEIERHRQVNAEGCKPDSNILLSSVPCAGTAPCRSLDKAEGGKPDLNTTSPGFIETVDGELRGGWIDIGERLPGDHLDGLAVIVTITHQRRGRISECDMWNKGGKKGRFELWGNKVTHWQPLPTPSGMKNTQSDWTGPRSQQQESQA